MDIKQLEYFLSVVKHNSFTEAAYENYISQSAISQQVKALEAHLGVKLINRRNRGFNLSPAGQYMAQHGKDILNHIERVEFETQRIGNAEQEQFVLGYLNRYSGIDLTTALTQLAVHYPDLAIRTVTGCHEELYQHLVDGTVDVILNDQWRQFSDAYDNDLIESAHTYVELSGGDAMPRTVTVSDLQGTNAILICKPQYMPGEEEYYRRVLGFTGGFIRTDSLEQARMLVASNQGFLLIDAIGNMNHTPPMIQRVPCYITRKQHLKRNYCFFSQLNRESEYKTTFVELFKQLIS